MTDTPAPPMCPVHVYALHRQVWRRRATHVVTAVAVTAIGFGTFATTWADSLRACTVLAGASVFFSVAATVSPRPRALTDSIHCAHCKRIRTERAYCEERPGWRA